MDKQLHIHILNALQQGNAIDKMVDIKLAFLDELDSQEKRKNFKAQLDYLVTEGLIETPSKYEFLGWELLTGLYPIDNKKIEARLIGKWESYLAKRGNVKSETFNLPLPPPPEPKVKLGLYDAPSTVLPYPGVNVSGKATPPTPPVAEEPAKSPFEPKDDDDFLPFTTKKPGAPPAADPNSVYLKEDDFLPFKTRSQAAKKAAKQQLPTEDPYAVKVSNYVAPEAPRVEEPKPEETIPKPASSEEPKPDVLTEFGSLKTTYSPPKTEVKDVAVTVKPFTPTPQPQHQAWKPDEQQPAPSIRITAHAKRKTEVEEDAPIITARTAGLRAKQIQPEPEPSPPEPQPVEVPTQRVVNLTSSAAAQTVRPVQVVAPVAAPTPAPVAAQNYQQHSPPPPSSNFAAVRFDTDNNPFNSLGTIDLTADEDAKPKTPAWVKVLKWTVYSIIILVIIAAVVIYKKRYS